MKIDNVEDIYELSPVQQGILYHVLYAPESTVYLEQLIWTLEGSLDVFAFEQAWQQVVDRHPVLRTSFHWEDLEKPFQIAHQRVTVSIEKLDWRAMSEVDLQERLRAHLKADSLKGFDFSKAPLMRLALIRTADNRFEFIWSFHHILMDGWSYALVFNEVFTFYEAFLRGQSLDLPRPAAYADYIEWRQEQDSPRAESFWRQTLKGFASPTPLGVDRLPSNRPASNQSYDQKQFGLSLEESAELQSFARRNHLTINTIMQGAWALLLSVYSGQQNVVFGATTSGRPLQLPGVESMVGLFINTLPARVQVDRDEIALGWLKRLQEDQAKSRQYEYSSLIDIQGWTDVARGVPLFESILVFENVLVISSPIAEAGSLSVKNFRYFGSTNYPLTVLAMPNAEFSIKIIYDCARFESEAISQMGEHVKQILRSMTANPQQRLSAVELLSEAEKEKLLVNWNKTKRGWGAGDSVVEMIEKQAESRREATAVEYEGGKISYKELNRRANRLAHYLRSIGVGPDKVVGLCVKRGPSMAIGMLGILKAGGAYLPMDPDYPQERLEYMLKDSRAATLLTERSIADKVIDRCARQVLIDADWDEITAYPDGNPGIALSPDNLLYVIYTSGSTGKPKGIGLSHGALRNLIEWHLTEFSPQTKTLQFASMSFDASFHELFAAWCSGGAAYILSESQRLDISALGHLISDAKIKKAILPVVVFQQLSEQGLSDGWLAGLQDIITTGEQLQITASIKELFETHPHITLHNHYGPSETHVITAYRFADSPDKWPVYPPIGRAIANTTTYILDKQLNLVPTGVPGELCIGGVSLARGYINGPDLTAAKFIPDMFSKEAGARLYKTGDLARYLPDGEIEFLGRMDNQVKIRGFRVEPGEVEAVLAQYPLIREAVVVAREDSPGNKRLVGYVVNNQEQAINLSELRRFLKQELPDYMIPAAFVVMDQLPLTPNGKVDRRALPAPDQSRPNVEEAFVAPRTPLEDALASICAEVLSIKQVGVYDNFFNLGGHSLLATQLVSRVKSRFRVEVPLRAFFQSPTVNDLAEIVEQKLLEEIGDLTEEEAQRLAQGSS